VLPTGYACSLNEPPKGAIAKASHAITLLIEWRLIHDVERLAEWLDGGGLSRRSLPQELEAHRH
jgi:NTE family protein